MPLTRKNVEQLMAMKTTLADPDLKYIHGFSAGLDQVVPGGPIGHEHDFSVYHAAIEDYEIVKPSTIPIIVARITSHLPEAIETFIRKWLDKDFKFT
jgi:hypothetical protein